VTTARGSGAALLAVINDILDISKIEAGRLEIEPSPFVLRECLEEAVGILTAKAQGKGLALSFRVADDVPGAIESDAARLRQILVNLLDNAIKFTPAGGTIRVALDRSDGEARVVVEDAGIGIPAEHLPHLFQRFYRVDPARGGKTDGTGLGLAICRSIAEAHGGRIRIDSIVGQGTRATLAVPLQEPPSVAAWNHELTVQDNGRTNPSPRRRKRNGGAILSAG
jgi:signal transduction histidine kinase